MKMQTCIVSARYTPQCVIDETTATIPDDRQRGIVNATICQST